MSGVDGGAVSFRTRLREAVAAHGPLCVGIDPHPGLLAGWGLEPDAAGVERFARGVVEALAGHVALVKPQVALFEVLGSAGLRALERALADARDAGVLTVADAKRGDIGSTMTGYARAWLADGAPLAADALTLSPYLGVGALAPALDLAAATGRGVFVLARTSNPEAAGVQSAQAWVEGPDGRRMREVAQSVVDALAEHNAAHRDGPGEGSAGAVVGLTRGTTGRDHGLDLTALGGPVLVPGLGAQGGTTDDVAATFGPPDALGATGGPVVPVSAREVLRAGPDPGALRAAVGALNGALTG
ncbi:orotidine-5'-phosphate decarboxylase [Actinomycetospora cinnamomea]|uniref:Orotidine 5'-phosphate decarboxylase n=1 Tax=Actinomycetospora cinnamomea TaxID=663609 RepID=A0A2U1FHZ1_9PSEU|nr:orotidine-5'-phosphate decarboxylase [Actinomycetospora cinnamomea]PVZ11803.1 orotidine-5'-phosphate decarboxylase [Actinomycetospora cinnamomea]